MEMVPMKRPVFSAVQGEPAAAEKKNFYEIFLLFIVGSFAGFIIETVWCLLKNGQIEARSGLLYTPFNMVYGIGTLALYLCMRNLTKAKNHHIFIVGAVAGTVVEFLCSYLQEAIFGTVSWDYTGVPFNIGGRVCLLYSLFWGALSILWVRIIYPNLSKMLGKIPPGAGKKAVAVLTVVLAIDIVLSFAAVTRWSLRTAGVPAESTIGTTLDELYPDSHMEVVYPNMKFMK